MSPGYCRNAAHVSKVVSGLWHMYVCNVSFVMDDEQIVVNLENKLNFLPFSVSTGTTKFEV